MWTAPLVVGTVSDGLWSSELVVSVQRLHLLPLIGKLKTRKLMVARWGFRKWFAVAIGKNCLGQSVAEEVGKRAAGAVRSMVLDVVWTWRTERVVLVVVWVAERDGAVELPRLE